MSKKNKKNNLNPIKEDKSIHVEQRDKIKEELNIREKFELTPKQKEIIEKGLDKNTSCIAIDGLWGTSKSYLATLIALKLLSSKKVDQIFYVRNPVESSTTGKLGFIKGEISEKMAPYNEIFFNKLEELLPSAEISKLSKDNRISCIPLGYTRGLSWNCKVIIVDEAASMSWDDILLLLTRCGRFTKIFFIGDSLNQNDIGNKSGFKKFFDLFSDQESKDNGVFTYELKEESDILRSGFVRFVMKKTGKTK